VNNDSLMRLSSRWFKLLLRLYPPDFRDEMGKGLTETYLDRSRDALRNGGAFRLSGIWFAALCDSLRNGLGERARPAVSWRRSGDWGRDMELVGRRFRQKPMFAIAVLTTLAVGLGIFAVVYTAVDKILIEPLPYRNPGDLYKVWAEVARLNVDRTTLSGPQVAELQRAGGAIQGVAGMGFGNGAIPSTDNRDAFHINMMVSSPNLFDLLGARPALGRVFRPDEWNGEPIVLSDGMWRRLGANPEIVGTKLRIGPDTHIVIGVMPPNFAFACSTSQIPDTYGVPAVEFAKQPYDGFYLQTVLRARPGASPEEVRHAVEAVGQSIVEQEPVTRRGLRFYSVGLQADLIREVRPALIALSFAALFLLLVLTVNLASLLLARAAEREKEFAISRALGANGPAVVRTTLLEGGILGFSGAVAGLMAGVWGVRLLVALGPLDLPRRETIALDWRVAAVVIVVGTLLGLMAAAAPALWSARISLAALVSASAVRGGAASARMRRSLIVVQVALSLVLLSAGGLVVRSFEHLVSANPGFKSDGILTLRLSTRVFTKPADAQAFYDRATVALRALPGVTSVSATTNLPLSGSANSARFSTVTFPGAPGNSGTDRDHPGVDILFTRAGYVETIGMRLLSGRTFEETRHEGVHEALIDRHLAEQFFPNGNAAGATMEWGPPNKLIVAGVVEQARLQDLYQDGRPQILLRGEDFPIVDLGYWYYVIRTNRDPHTLISEVRGAIRQVDRRIPVSQMWTMDEIVAERRSRERLSAVLIAGLALGALLLVSMGLFGMISGSVSRRRGELAVRLALGATHHRVIRLVVAEGARLVIIGLVISVPGIYMAGQALRGFLIGVTPSDTPTLAAVSIGLLAVTLLSCYLAARRLTAIDPDRLLRDGG
jgi:putative ABC transport system permease protein